MNYKQPEAKYAEVEPLTYDARQLHYQHRDSNCTKCELHKWAKTVCMFGNGPVPAKGMLIGEGPGSVEDATGRPFQGKSGKYLESVLADLDLYREDFYISNATKCKPPMENKDELLKIAVKECADYLEAEIAAVKPRVILAIGNYAYYFFKHQTGITKNRGKEFWSEKHNALVVPTVHPAFIMQSPNYHEAFYADVVKFKNILLNKKPPEIEIMEIHNLDDFDQAMLELNENPDDILTFDLETRGLIDYRPSFSKVWCAGITRNGKKSYIIPLEHPESPFVSPNGELWKEQWPNVQMTILPEYRRVVEATCDLILRAKVNNHNVKFDLRHLIRLAERYGLRDRYFTESGDWK